MIGSSFETKAADEPRARCIRGACLDIRGRRTEAADGVLDLVVRTGGAVPSIWPLEVANTLLMVVRRGRIDQPSRDRYLHYLSELDIEIDTETSRFAWTSTQNVAERFRLTLYDASYLELALRRGLPIATLDRDLRRAASEAGVTLANG